MGRWIVDLLHERRGGQAGSALVMGLTFKEEVPDLRNGRSFDLVQRLQELGYAVDVADPYADARQLQADHGLDLIEPDGRSYDLVIGAVAHRQYRELPAERLARMVRPGGTLADIKGMWRDRDLEGVDRWSL
jgi:UDP-N-acetyl-D-galactosamine dehydrogenase